MELSVSKWKTKLYLYISQLLLDSFKLPTELSAIIIHTMKLRYYNFLYAIQIICRLYEIEINIG